MTSRRLLVSARDRVFPHLLILLYSLGAAVIYDHHWPFRGHGDSPILDLVDFHHPAPWIHSLFLSEPAGLVSLWCWSVGVDREPEGRAPLKGGGGGLPHRGFFEISTGRGPLLLVCSYYLSL